MASGYQSVKSLLLKNLLNSKSMVENLDGTYIDLVNTSGDSKLQEFKAEKMEPFVHNSVMTAQCSSIQTNTCDIKFEDNIMQFGMGTLDLNYGANLTTDEKLARDKGNYKNFRKWQKISNQSERMGGASVSDVFKLRILSFNILAQNLLEAYPNLYKYHDKDALTWELRKSLVWEEIDRCDADIICLQEMQEEHLADFVKPYLRKGYLYLYKKRTHEKVDGLLLLYRQDRYNLIDHAKVEYYRPGIEILSRDNVGLIAKFQLKDYPATQFIVATTHLLYNPWRNDVRLGQVQLLFSELEKMSFVTYDERSKPEYLPIILTGDFNLKPYTGVYKFIVNGYLKYYNKNRKLVYNVNDHSVLGNSLIPSYLNVTNDCQNFDVLKQRLGVRDEEELIEIDGEQRNYNRNYQRRNVVDQLRVMKLPNGFEARFSTGYVTHPFGLQSVYVHKDPFGKMEATTNQGTWITVDYIFYSGVRPIEKYILPTVKQCEVLPTIPNFAVGSDHLCLGATFEIEKKKQ